jgi:hypothetical protein
MIDISLVFQGAQGWGVYRDNLGRPDLYNFPKYFYRIYRIEKIYLDKALEYLYEIQERNGKQKKAPQRDNKESRLELFPDLPVEFTEVTDME